MLGRAPHTHLHNSFKAIAQARQLEAAAPWGPAARHSPPVIEADLLPALPLTALGSFCVAGLAVALAAAAAAGLNKRHRSAAIANFADGPVVCTTFSC